ncbi:MAG: DUF4019 domain-containing protein [Gammaproteobacteria bacterium]|nr:DUF4019 domain-containing protein [Gammaproteobacteria bacterium]
MRTRGEAAACAAPRWRGIGGRLGVLVLASVGTTALAATPVVAKPTGTANPPATAKSPVATHSVAAAKVTAPIKAAEAVASAWLPLIDTAQWVPAWNATGSYLHATVAEAKWLTSIARVRLLTGALVARTLESAYETTYLPGAPYGHYVVVYYASRFVHRRTASETLTLMEDSAGAWRVVGYYLK